MPFVTFSKKSSARTGNILFQYLFCKAISYHYGHIYIPIEEFDAYKADAYTVTDENAADVCNGSMENAQHVHILCDGFFQKADYFVPIREPLLNTIYDEANTDYWIGWKGRRQTIHDFLKCSHKCPITPNDVVVSLRLDDFIQLPCATSDIIPPQYYLNILEHMYFDKLYIVCDTIRHQWERTYLQFFDKWSPILLQEDLMHDCALIRDAPVLLHSNSTLCWFMSFVSRTKTAPRYIAKTNFYSSQKLDKIEPSDVLTNVQPMLHKEVFEIHTHPFLKKYIYPLSYCIPDECIVNHEQLLNKHIIISDLIPGELHTYRFTHDKEVEYNQMYQESRFAYTSRKGGWDCLRHYEIMANGCIPIFKHLETCPDHTMTTFPKSLVQNAFRELLPWKEENIPKYNEYVGNMLDHMREHCSTSATTRYFLSKMAEVNPRPIKNVLLIMGNCGVNYTRETFWIGMKRYIQSIGGVAVEYPKIDFLYRNFSASEKRNLYGNGFTYAYRLEDDYQFSEADIVDKIQNKFWDVIIYGKVGPDELAEGSLPHMPLWEHVFKRYGKHEIVFLYGGDGCQDMTCGNRYSGHLIDHARYAQCFVRELRY